MNIFVSIVGNRFLPLEAPFFNELWYKLFEMGVPDCHPLFALLLLL